MGPFTGYMCERKFGIGYWKALLLRWHPERVVRDSHTPQVLKLQIGLVGLLGPSLLLTPFWAPARWSALFFAVLGIMGSGRIDIPTLSDENDFCLFINRFS